MISHDLLTITRLADRILIFRKGRLEEVAGFRSVERLEELFRQLEQPGPQAGPADERPLTPPTWIDTFADEVSRMFLRSMALVCLPSTLVGAVLTLQGRAMSRTLTDEVVPILVDLLLTALYYGHNVQAVL